MILLRRQNLIKIPVFCNGLEKYFTGSSKMAAWPRFELKLTGALNITIINSVIYFFGQNLFWCVWRASTPARRQGEILMRGWSGCCLIKTQHPLLRSIKCQFETPTIQITVILITHSLSTQIRVKIRIDGNFAHPISRFTRCGLNWMRRRKSSWRKKKSSRSIRMHPSVGRWQTPELHVIILIN